MASAGTNPPTGNAPRPKPYELAGTTSSGPSPFRPPSTGKTSDVVEASGTSKPGEIISTAERSTNTVVPRPPLRSWEQNYGNTYGGYSSGMNHNSGYGSSMYGGTSMYGGSYGSPYNSMYRGGMYGGAYGNSMYGGSMYGGGMYGTPMSGGYGMGMPGPYGNQDPNNPTGPPQPPSFWMSFLRVMHGVVDFFGRISFLIDQNTQSFHFLMSAMLQFFERSGMLYGELARFVLRLLGIRVKPRKQQQAPGQLPGPDGQPQMLIEGPKAASGSWDNVWGDDASKAK